MSIQLLTKQYRRAIMWFRSDLRLHDNPALTECIARATEVIPLFVLDDNLLRHDRLAGSARVLFMLESLSALDEALRERGSKLVLRYNDPQLELPFLCKTYGVSAVFYNQDVDRAYGIERDRAVRETLAQYGVEVVACQQYAVWPTKQSSHDEWKQAWRSFNAQALLPAPTHLPTPTCTTTTHDEALSEGEGEGAGDNWPPTLPIPQGLDALARLGVPDLGQTTQAGGEKVAAQLFEDFINKKVSRYYFAVSYPHQVDENEATSLLSPHLKFGTISGRGMIHKCAGILSHEPDLSPSERKSLERFITRLRWRESMYQSLYAYPAAEFEEYQPVYRGVRRVAQGELWEAYLAGQTGFPMIDAGVRCLKRTGRLAFRIRAALASFVCYGLFMEPQAGKDFFHHYLIDSNPINWWQWQLQAGTVGYSGFFQIFNPTVQSRKYDPQGAFLKKWVPELEKVPVEVVGEPWRLSIIEQHNFGCVIGQHYPARILDWRTARRNAVRILDPLRLQLLNEPGGATGPAGLARIASSS